MTLDDFKQYMLFQLLDVGVPDWAQWVVVLPTDDGFLSFYDCKPHPTEYNGWMVEASKYRCVHVHRTNETNSPLIRMKIPDGIEWQDCMVRLNR